MNLLETLRRPVIFAHRGDSAHAPENTLAAFRQAVAAGADAIELDAKLTVDGEVYVFHDLTLERTSDGRGSVKQARWAELKDLDAGGWFAAQFTGERIPLLGQVFEEVGRQVYINIELTNYATPGDALVERVVELVKRHAMQERVLFSSFHPLNLRRVRRRLPDAKIAMLAWTGWAGSWQRGFIGRWLAPEILHPFLKDVTPTLLQKEHARQRRVHVWTVNGEDDLRRLMGWGVDGIFTDYPARAVQLREEQ